jgi:hypothetical protein
MILLIGREKRSQNPAACYDYNIRRQEKQLQQHCFRTGCTGGPFQTGIPVLTRFGNPDDAETKKGGIRYGSETHCTQ